MFLNSKVADFILIVIAVGVAAAFIAGLFFEHPSLQRNTTLAMTTFLFILAVLQNRQLRRKVNELQIENRRLKAGVRE